MIAKKIIFYLLCSVHFYSMTTTLANQKHNTADLVVFSYDRPLQLYAFLESATTYIKGLNSIFVLSRTSNSEYAAAYQEVYKHFKDVIVVEQDNETADDNFKQNLCHIVKNKSEEPYIIFAVDDIVVCDHINIRDCIKYLAKANAIGFYLRLGKNITEHYHRNTTDIPLPMFHRIAPEILRWKFKRTEAPWNYPHTVDMTIFKKSYVLPTLETLSYKGPNTLEEVWCNVRAGTHGLCYTHSKIVNIPLNIVQKVHDNRHTGLLSAEQLLKLFQNGLKMNIKELAQCDNKSPHYNFSPSFIPRDN